MHLGDGHGVLVGALPSLLGVHGDAGAGPQVAVEQVVVHPWEAQALVVVQLPCCCLAAADPHCCLCFACLRRVSSVLPCPPLSSPLLGLPSRSRSRRSAGAGGAGTVG